VPGVNVYLQNPPLIRIGGMLTKSLYQFTLQGPDLEELYQLADRIVVMSAGRIVGDFAIGEASVEKIGLLMTGGSGGTAESAA